MLKNVATRCLRATSLRLISHEEFCELFDVHHVTLWHDSFKEIFRDNRKQIQARGPFLERPETLRAIFGCHNSLCISRTERI